MGIIRLRFQSAHSDQTMKHPINVIHSPTNQFATRMPHT